MAQMFYLNSSSSLDPLTQSEELFLPYDFSFEESKNVLILKTLRNSENVTLVKIFQIKIYVGTMISSTPVMIQFKQINLPEKVISDFYDLKQYNTSLNHITKI